LDRYQAPQNNKMQKRTPTQKQLKLLKLIKENYGKAGSTKGIGELMREAGYKEKSSKKNSKVITNSPVIQEGVKEIVTTLDTKRDMVLRHITEKKLTKVHPRDLTYMADVFIKDSRLFQGKATEIKTLSISDILDG
jgi:hypothetical protein